MNANEYARMFAAEDHHWWYLGMAAITRAILNRYVQVDPDCRVLDAGCGTGGAMSTFLADYGKVLGIDVTPVALEFCQTRHLTQLALASVDGIPFKSESFEIVASLDVIYESHVTRDSVAVAEFLRVLRPGGFLFLRVPAYEWLRGEHDLTVESARRYTLQGLRRLIEGAGFEIAYMSYANAWLFPLVVAKRLVLERIWPSAPDTSDLSFSVGVLNDSFRRILASEAHLAGRLSIPFGSSVLALGRKPPN